MKYIIYILFIMSFISLSMVAVLEYNEKNGQSISPRFSSHFSEPLIFI